jgi:recombinational DNA repair protein (RecF pathway)
MADKAGQSLILIQFIWRYLGIAGFRPDTEHCGRCNSILTLSEPVWFDERDNQIICAECRTNMDSLQFSAGGLKYLRHTVKLDLDKSMRISLDYRSADILKRIMLAMIQGIVEYPLNTLKKGLI